MLKKKSKLPISVTTSKAIKYNSLDTDSAKKNQLAITPKMEGEMLNINKTVGWNAFVSEFMMQSGRIAQYFGVPNKFKLSGQYIIYR
jgi:hypothetical protein